MLYRPCSIGKSRVEQAYSVQCIYGYSGPGPYRLNTGICRDIAYTAYMRIYRPVHGIPLIHGVSRYACIYHGIPLIPVYAHTYIGLYIGEIGLYTACTGNIG